MIVTLDQIRHHWLGFSTAAKHPTAGFMVHIDRYSAPTFVAATHLAALDSLLPDVMTACAAKVGPTRSCWLLQQTLLAWNTPLAVSPYLQEDQRKRLVQLISISHLGNNAAHVVADRWRLDTSVVPGRAVVVDVDSSGILLAYDWLEQHFPGSVQRLRLAVDLELSGRMLHDYVLPAPVLTVDVTLPETLSWALLC